MLNDIKAAVPVGAAAFLGTRLARSFTAGKSALWEIAGGIAGATLGVVLAKKFLSKA